MSVIWQYIQEHLQETYGYQEGRPRPGTGSQICDKEGRTDFVQPAERCKDKASSWRTWTDSAVCQDWPKEALIRSTDCWALEQVARERESSGDWRVFQKTAPRDNLSDSLSWWSSKLQTKTQLKNQKLVWKSKWTCDTQHCKRPVNPVCKPRWHALSFV